MQKDKTVKCQINQLIDQQDIRSSVRFSVFVFFQNPFFMIEGGFHESFSEEQKKAITPILANLPKLDLFVTELHYVIMNIHLNDIKHTWRSVLFICLFFRTRALLTAVSLQCTFLFQFQCPRDVWCLCGIWWDWRESIGECGVSAAAGHEEQHCSLENGCSDEEELGRMISKQKSLITYQLHFFIFI